MPVFILLGVLILAILGGGLYYFNQQTAPAAKPQITISPTPRPTPVDETTGWKIYTDSANNYVVKYPPELTLESYGLQNLKESGMNSPTIFQRMKNIAPPEVISSSIIHSADFNANCVKNNNCKGFAVVIWILNNPENLTITS